MTGNLSRLDVGFIDQPTHATPMIAVGVRVDHGGDGQALPGMLLEQLPCGAHHLGRHQGIEHDPTGLAAHEGNVREIEAAHLIDAGDHLVESVVVVQFGLTQQRGVDAVELVLLIQELEALHVPRYMAGIGHDLEVFHRSDEALLLLLDIPRIGER